MPSVTNPMAAVCGAWLGKINLALDFKRRRFQKDADEGMKFLAGPYDWMYGEKGAAREDRRYFDEDDGGDIPAPRFKMTVNKAAELVQLFGPVLYHQNPTRTVTPRAVPVPDPALMAVLGPDPAAAVFLQQSLQGAAAQRATDAARAKLLGQYLNYTPNALGLMTESRFAIDEAIVKGMGCLSGGVKVYATIDGRHTVLRVRDLARIESPNTYLWDGDRWNRVVGVKKKPRVGNELKITLRSGEYIDCTVDHGWPTQRGLLRADDLKVGDRFSYVQLDQPTAPCGDLLPDEVGWLVGLFLGDGHILADKPDVAFGIAGHIDEKDRHDKLQRLVDRYGGRITWRGKEGSKKWNATVYSRVMVAIIREYVAVGGAFKKHLSTTCWNRSNDFLRAVLQGYLDSDGHYVENEDVWRLHFCDNKELAGSIRTLAGRLGLRLTLRRIREPLPERPNHHTYQGRLRLGQSKIKVGDLGEIVAIEPADWRCDFFYDISVESEPHTYCLASGLVTHNCIWTETYQTPTGQRMVGSFYDSVENLVIDPDATTLQGAKWIARRRVQPVWEAERRFQLQPGTLKATSESYSQQAATDSDPTGVADYLRKTGQTQDLITYWDVYSKCGVGRRLSGTAQDFAAELEYFGDYAYLAVCGTCQYPLNVPDALWDLEATQARQQIGQRLQWHTPFWADDAWPVSELAFHNIPNDPWPLSHLAPGMGELKFLNWAYSLLAGKLRITFRDFIAYLEEAGDEVKQAIVSGADYELIPIKGSHGKGVNDLIQFLQHPPFNGDMYRVLDLIAEQFDRRVGLNELMYGQSSRQFRSAAEAEIKQRGMSVRPDDMANKVEDWMAAAARKEGIAARWHLAGKDVVPVLGQFGAQLWDRLVVPSNPMDILYAIDYRIESGSVRKPNRERDAANAKDALQTLMPFFQPLAMQGLVGPYNALVRAWGESIDLNTDAFMLPEPPPMPPPGAAPPQGPPPGQQAA